jgi:peroxiredoxin
MTDNPELSIGSLAPNFTLASSTGVDVSLSDFHSKSNVYLFFVREYI